MVSISRPSFVVLLLGLALCVSCSTPTTTVQSAATKESTSEDCFAKRDSLNRRRGRGGRPRSIGDSSHKDNSTLGYQRLHPKQDHSTVRHSNVSSSPEINIDGGLEHVPECTVDGKYEPIQCLMDYCWCVNKYGQALKNTAKTNEKPICDRKLYESESNDLLVVTGIGATRMKNILEPSNSKRHSEGGATTNDGLGGLNRSSRHKDSDTSEFSRRIGNSPEPSLALAPDECAMSRENAMSRKSKHRGLDDIWIPDCDPANGKLYAERQCHKSKVCWCVDQSTGLPLHSNAQLKKEPGINCTEVKKIIEVAASKPKQESNQVRLSFFQGFSESCDAPKRSEFVSNLINQFRQQLGDYLKHNPSISSPSDFGRLTGSQIASWRFTLLDIDEDGKLDEREWSKFKKNFKLVDRLDNNSLRFVQHEAGYIISPLSIPRSQRRCWRDFLEFCGDGDVLDYSAIDQSKWLSCTELPGPLDKLSPLSDRHKYGSSVPDAYTRTAAENRRSSKNPFIGILKPD